MGTLALTPTRVLQPSRRVLLRSGSAVAAASWLPGFMTPKAEAASSRLPASAKGATNEVVETINDIKRKRLGGGDIIVSEMGLGTQRWGSNDFNAPDEAMCHKFMDRAILEGGINMIDTAEQYPLQGGDRVQDYGRWQRQRKEHYCGLRGLLAAPRHRLS